MLHTLRFSLQNAVYFIMLPFLVPVLFTFYIQDVLKFKCKIPAPKGKKLFTKSHGVGTHVVLLTCFTSLLVGLRDIGGMVCQTAHGFFS